MDQKQKEAKIKKVEEVVEKTFAAKEAEIKAKAKKAKEPKVASEEKTEAKASANYLQISPKHSVNILNFIRYKDVDKSIDYLQKVIKKERAIPFPRYNRDNPHRKGDMEKGKYPFNASKKVIELLKSAKANAKSLGLGEENLIISKAISNRSFSKRSKRGRFTNIEVALSKKGVIKNA